MASKQPQKDPDAPKDKGGRPAFQATEEQRGAVRALAIFGLPRIDIAKYIDIDVDTLEKYFMTDLVKARPSLMALAAKGLGSHLRKGEWKAIRFMLETQGRGLGWVSRKELTGPNGAPIPVLQLDAEKLKGMETDELAALERAIVKLGSGGSSGPNTGGEGEASESESD